MSLFDNPDIASATSYTLRCKASSGVVRILLGRLEGKPEEVTITDENFNELRDLCYELGFSGLDNDLRAFEAEARNSLERQIFLLNNRITRHDKLLMEIQGQLALILGEKQTAGSVFHEIELIQKRVDELAILCDRRAPDASKMIKRAEDGSPEPPRNEAPARNLAPREQPGKVPDKKGRSPPVKHPGHSALPPLDPKVKAPKQEKPGKQKKIEVKPDPPVLARKLEFIYDASRPLRGIIAPLSLECGGNVHERKVVYVMGSRQYCTENVVDLGTDSAYESSDETESWICYDFRDRRVIPASYSIIARDWPRLRDWVVEVSND